MSVAKRTADLKVGTRVGVRFGGRLLAGLIIEDRGHLGPRRQQVVRVRAEDPDVDFDIEVPVEWLEPIPHL